MATLAEVLRGFTPPITSALADPIKEHFRTLPQQLATNQQAMDKTMAGMYKTDFGTGQPNPNYYPEAMGEFTSQYLPAVMGSTTAVRMAKAMENAMLPLEKGGLGLPAGNTAAQRAKALGFTDEAYHGTNADIQAFNPMMADTRRGTGTPMGAIVVSSNPKTASTYAGEMPTEWIKSYSEGGNVMPLLINKGNNMSMNATQQGYTPNWKEIYNPKYPDIETTNDFAAIAKEKSKQSATIKNVKDNAVMSGAEGDTTFIFDPSLIRSRFAAFDPKRKKEADLLAGALAVPMVDEDNRKAMLEQLFKKQK